MHLSAKQISDAKPGPIDVGKRKWRLAIPLANSLGGICLFGLLLLVSLLPRRDDPSDYFLGFVLGLIFMQI